MVDVFIYLKQILRLMINTKMMTLVVMVVAFIGFGAAIPIMPVITEVSAQGNVTGDATGNWTDAGSDASGNISGAVLVP